MKLLTLSALVLALSTGVKGLSLIKEMVIAGAYGLGNELDAYLYGFVLLSFLVNVTAASLGVIYLPTLSQALAKNDDSCVRFMSGIGILVAGAGTIFTLLFIIIIFSLSSMNLISSLYTTLLLWLSPLLIIGTLNIWIVQSLIALQKTLLTTAITFITPLIILGAVSLYGANSGGTLLAGMTVLGTLIESVILLVALNRIMPLTWSYLNKEMYLSVLYATSPVALSSLLTGLALVIEQSFATSLGSGAVSAYAYGQRVPFFLISLGIIIISSVLFPYFSHLWAKGKREEYFPSVHKIAAFVMFIGSTTAIIFLFFSEHIITILFARGAFNAEAVKNVGIIQSAFAVQIGLHLALAVYTKALSAMNANSYLLKISLFMLVTNIILDLILMPSLGVAGLAFASSLTQGFALIIGFFIMKKFEKS